MAILSTEAQNQLAEFMPLNELNHIQSNRGHLRKRNLKYVKA